MKNFYRILFVGCACLVYSSAANAQQLPGAAFDSAGIAWAEGDYVDALVRLERLMSGPRAESFLAPVALLTGELYVSTQIAPDGHSVRWSPDGRYAVYETDGDSGVQTHMVAFGSDGTRSVATIDGHGLVFSPSAGRVAYLAIEDPAAFSAAAEAVRARAGQIETREQFNRLRQALDFVEAAHTGIRIRELTTGDEREVRTPRLGIHAAVFDPHGEGLYAIASTEDDTAATNVWAVGMDSDPRQLTNSPSIKTDIRTALAGERLIYSTGDDQIEVLNVPTGAVRELSASAPTISADGSTLAFVGSVDGENTINVVALGSGADPVVVQRTPFPVDNPALSPNGESVIYQMMPREDWELFTVGTAGGDGADARRLTREIQHDLFPRYVDASTILAVKGEGRHRRSYLYDAATGERTRLFHNNTVRTVAPEYEWAAAPDGSRVLIVAERDGNTVSPERGVFVMDLERQVTTSEVLARVRGELATERQLRENGREMFAPIAEAVAAATDEVSVTRLYRYANDLFQFGSKYITEPGNRLAMDYLVARLQEFGYEPELQWFEPQPGVRTANIIARLPGTADPELVYVISSHFDSSERGPGADDNSSGTSVLLETARIMADRPMPATIEFAFFTGEEAGLLGSREYVRRAVLDGKNIVGALNNDMIGYANDERLDNTIRYSNAGIRDLQHAAAIQFSDLITYDAEYYKNTDAHAYYEEYGDIVGGIGSYPILANPHYHRSHDVLETINHQLVAEVAKATTASIMLLASSPARLAGLEVERGERGDVSVSWTPAAEQGVDAYIVAYGPEDDPLATLETVTEPRITLEDLAPDTVVSVKAQTSGGLEGWDWAKTVVP
ncbi:MAG TPA: M28 family peptidase [Longimicrobiaceae bacterium]|nr:M28 family peptidase [Longimicrobiaceae bacterium]